MFRRTVSVGGEVIIRLPATMGSREWQLTTFDSLKLPVTTPLQLQERGGSQEWVGRFAARHPGETAVEYTRVAALPENTATIGERRLYRFWIRE